MSNLRLLRIELNEIAKWARSEEDLRIESEKLLSTFLKQAKITLKGHHEVSIGTGRADSVYSLVIIEYKKPGRLTADNSSVGNSEVIGQLKDRFLSFEREENRPRNRMFGVGLDGNRLIFLRYRSNEWEISPALEVNERTVKVFLRRLSSLGSAGKALLPEYLLGDFGAESPRTRKCVRAFYLKTENMSNPRSKKLFEQWQVMYSEVCGYQIASPKSQMIELSKKYGTEEDANTVNLLFAIHSYYAAFMKFLAAEIISFYHRMPSYLGKLGALTGPSLKEELVDLERGGIFAQMGITNFLEGDLFSWYLDEWNSDIEGAIRSVIEGLEEYDPGTLSVEPQEAKDLLKQLYQYLVDRSVRHDLGEFYTPDWLAELVLDEAGYRGDPNKRMLDPSCGSGTFLVTAINKIRQFAEENMIADNSLLVNIIQNVVGFDLNPLAVMAARVNYLIALGALVRYRKGEIEIPVYLCDSIQTPQEFTTIYTGSRRLKTSVGTFDVPLTIVDKRKVGELSNLLETCSEREYTTNEFLKLVRSKLGLSDAEYDQSEILLRELYEKILDLEKKGINGIWSRIIKNAFAPVFLGTFDFVLGNPPWINWENLPEDYRESTSPLWDFYRAGSKGKKIEEIRVRKNEERPLNALCLCMFRSLLAK